MHKSNFRLTIPIFIFVLLLGQTVLLSSCSKDDANGTSTPVKKSMVGTWTGKWGDVGQDPQNFIKFQFKSGGELVRLDQQGQIIANGTWKVSGVQFECSYVHTNNGEKHSIGGMYTDFDGEIVGTWGYGNSKANGGTISLKKQ